MLSANSKSFTSFFFSIWIPFISFSSLIAVARTSETMFNNNDGSEHPCLILDLRGNAFNFSPLRIMFAVGLSFMVLITLRYVPSMLAFWREFYYKWVLNFVKGFPCIYWDNHIDSIFQFVNIVNHIYWFVNNEESLHPWNKAHLVKMYDLCNMLLDSVC